MFFFNLGYGLWIFVLILLMAACLLEVLKNQGDEPQRTSLWFVLILGFPALGVILYFLAGRSRGRMKRRVRNSILDFIEKVRSHSRFSEYYARMKKYKVSGNCLPDSAFDRILPDTLSVSGNRVSLLIDGTEAYPAMLESINAAKHSILLQSFIIADDEMGHYILKTLEDKAKEGVEVKVLYDSFGSFFSSFYRMFRKYGRNIPTFHIKPFSVMNSLTRWRFQLRNHRKLLVVDGQIAYLGGVNISDGNISQKRKQSSAIHDFHCKIQGPVVGELEVLFLRDWFYASGETKEQIVASAQLPAVESCGNCAIRVVGSGWGQCYQGSERIFHTAVATAKKSIWIISPYFVPDTPFIMALRMAVVRGVDVRVIVPALNNHFYVKMAACSFYETLLEEGVRIFERKDVFVHAKAMIVDSEWAMIGSSNCDVRSFRLNFELDTVIRGSEFIPNLKSQFETEFANSEEVSLESIDAKPWIRRAGENLCALLTPLL